MDPLGNIPNFMATLRQVPTERLGRIIFRECLFALAVLLAVLAGGRGFMAIFGLSSEALRIAGGIMLFLIALRMIFPEAGGERVETVEEEPFIVPLATPLIAGPSLIATNMVLAGNPTISRPGVFAAILAAWSISTLILLSAPFFARILGRRGIMAVERLMGMLLVVVAVQMFLDGLHLPSRLPG
ncbi:MAG: putative antibiotic transporter [Verrucomicrobiales bacterium]|nr:putative antibiotic transporter [Verrucomicrobiales bacterium]